MREDRRITFEPDEVYKAIYTLCSTKDMKRPMPGTVQSFSEKDGEAGAVVMKIKGLDEVTMTVHEYSRDFIAAALLSFCRGMGVPIPKKARKSIIVAPGNVVMRVEI